MKIKNRKKNWISSILFVLAILLVGFSLQLSFAAEININKNSNLGQTIANANPGDTIILDSGTYTNNVNNIEINKDLIIKGNGPTKDVIIDAKGISRMFTLGNNVNVKFINITFINGNNTGHGGAIWNNHANTLMSVINCSFINNTVRNSTITNTDGHGGAISNRGNNFILENSNFINNTGNSGGSNGGAIYNTGHNFNIKNSIFTNNTAYEGGAIYNDYADGFTVINSSFMNNFGNGRGFAGAIQNVMGEYFSIDKSNFINNLAIGINGGYGGAVMNSGRYFQVTNSYFKNNNAPSGAGGGYGGAIYNSARYFSVKNTIFEGNNGSIGAAIINRASAPNCSIINCNFTNNTGFNSGAISNEGHNFTIANCIFANNRVENIAGAVSNSGQNLTLMNSIFKNNHAGNFGGGLSIGSTGHYAMVFNCTFINNSATSSGGAIQNAAANLTINNSSFTGNSAGNGSAIRNTNVNLTVSNSTFTNNTALTNGGAIHSTSANLTVANSTFINNTATGTGGAIHNAGANLKVDNSTFIGNIANNGGGIYNTGANSNVTSSTFTGNTAKNQGGGIYNIGSMFVSSNTMTNNIANLGNMIYNAGTMGNLKLTFLNNSTIKVSKNQKITLFATLTDDMGNTVTGKNINFIIDGTIIGSVSSIEGKASLDYITPDFRGLITVTGNYTGHIDDPILLNGQLSIKTPTNSTIVVPDNIKVGQKVNITGVVKDEDGNIVADIELSITIDGKNYTVYSDDEGRWFLSYDANHKGLKNIIVTFSGNDIYFGFENTTSFMVVNEDSNGTENGTDNGTDKDPDNGTDKDSDNGTDKDPNEKRPAGPGDKKPIPEGEEEKDENPNKENNLLKKGHASMKPTGVPIAILLILAIFTLVTFRRKIQ